MGKTKKVSAPAPRDYKQEMLDSMAGQEAIQPRLLALEKQYQPLYQQLQQEMMDRQMEYQLDSYGKAIPKSAELSGQFARAMSPVYGEMGVLAQNAYRQGMGEPAMGLYDSLMTSAQTDLAAGRNLTPEMERVAQQTARQAMAARGLTGNQAIAQEVLNSYQMADARENRARQFAGNMYAAGQGNFQNAMATYGNPMMTQANAYSPANLYGNAYTMSQGLGAQIFNPESQYNANLITANRKEAMDVQIANAQASNAKRNAIIGAVGQVAGAAMGNTSLFGGGTPTSALGGGGNLGSMFSASSGGTSLSGGLNFGNYSLGGGGVGLQGGSGGGFKF
jgi:hypothetical protein